MSSFDVIVIGAGHAGVEAAYAAARLGCHVGLCTLSRETVAHMPCNPAIGGTAKGHLVREIDALGGLMAKAIDATGIQFKLLNRSRGPAVWSPRAQADKTSVLEVGHRDARRRAQHLMDFRSGGSILSSSMAALSGSGDAGWRSSLPARALVVTTGTFLNGLIHVGPEKRPAGRHGEPPAAELAKSIRALGFTVGRLKTGTPPRLDRKSIDFDGAYVLRAFRRGARGRFSGSLLVLTTGSDLRNRVSCWLLHTNDAVHDLVRAHIEQSPLYNGQIQGVGPRYCPSLEDKVMRFPDRERHQIYLEPEGLDVDEIYVNGFSMSLPQRGPGAARPRAAGSRRRRR